MLTSVAVGAAVAGAAVAGAAVAGAGATVAGAGATVAGLGVAVGVAQPDTMSATANAVMISLFKLTCWNIFFSPFSRLWLKFTKTAKYYDQAPPPSPGKVFISQIQLSDR
jgi:hypothetical protein